MDWGSMSIFAKKLLMMTYKEKRNALPGFGDELRKEYEIQNMDENSRLTRESVKYSKSTLIVSIIALIVSTIALFK